MSASTIPRLRIFLSSPTDVNWERLRAHLIIRRLAREYRRYFTIEAFLWEYEPMLASQHFQDAIDPPGSYDIVIVTLWSRLGTPLPPKTEVREYAGIDGRTPVTGTEWEFEDALQAARLAGGKGPPDLLVYRRVGGVLAALDDPSRREEAIRQYDALEAFWRRWFGADTRFLAGFATYQDPAAFEHRLEADLRTLIERRIKERHAEPAADWMKSSPFRGLRAYDFGDAPVFFGRYGEISDGLTGLLEAAERGTAFLLVSGPSGSGKSSLARAGLLPSLLAPQTVSGVGLWRRVIMRPGDAGRDPVLALARAVLASGAQGEGLPELAGRQMSAEELAAHLASGGDPAFLFARTLRELADSERARLGLLPHEQARLVLLIDQLEELVTRAEIDPEQRALFIRIVALLARCGVVWVIATVRSDLWHRLEEVQELRELARRGARLDLAPPDVAQLLEMIRKPAQAAGLAFDIEPRSELSLDAMLAREAEAQPGVLPLLSVMLDELYERDVASGGGSLLTVASYRKLGGLHAAIGQWAEARLQEIQASDAAAARALPRVLRALVTVSAAGAAPAARAAPLTAFAPASPERRLVDALVAPDARLLTAEDHGQGPEVRLAHEALIGHWPRAQAIVTESARFILLRAEIETQRHRWVTAERRPELLLAEGLPLRQARELVSKLGPELSPEILSFINASRRRVRGRWGVRVAAAALVLVTAGYAAWWWDQNLRIKTFYCANYTERWAMPVCVGPLDAATQAARGASYRFRTQGGRVLELARVGGTGYPVVWHYESFQEEAWNRGVALWRFTYPRGDAPGVGPSPASVIMEGPTGVILRRVTYQFSDDHRRAYANFDAGFGIDEGQLSTPGTLGLALGKVAASNRSAIRRHLLELDAAGRLLRRDFLPATGSRTIADGLGSHGRVYDYDAAGQMTRMRNLDAQGNTLVDRWGNAGQTFAYDAHGDLVSAAWVDRDGRLHANQQGFARFVWTRDHAGNLIEERLLTSSGALTNRSDLGYARTVEIVDAHGNIVDERLFDAQGRPVLSRDQGVARNTRRYDARGDVIEYAVFGLDGKPTLNKIDGVARFIRRYDDRRNLVEERYAGTAGRPILDKVSGVARAVFRYDRQGHRVEEACFGLDNRPILSKGRFARVTMRYDNGQLVEKAFFGVDGKLTAGIGGFARVQYQYDDRGNQVEWADFDADGRPVANSSGVARETIAYDERGNDVEHAYFGVDGRPVLNRDGIARVTYRNDDRGNVIEAVFFGVNGKPAANNSGVVRTRIAYDERGNSTELAFFSKDGVPVADKSIGCARLTSQYDARNNVIDSRCYGVDGKMVATVNGFARKTYKYDERGNKTEEAYFGADGMPVLSARGDARETARYDERGNVTEVASYGINGELVNGKDGEARLIVHYDRRGNMVEKAFFGADGKAALNTDLGYARSVRTYDARDNMVDVRYFGVDGRPILVAPGAARITRRYDERGNKVEEDYFGVDGVHPVPGVARYLYSYDAQDRLIEENHLDALGHAAVLKQLGAPVSRIRYSYNAANVQVDEAYYDEQGSRIPVEVKCQQVFPGGVAQRLGLLPGDRLLRYDDVAIQSTAQFVAVVRYANPGMHRLSVRRGAAIRTLDVPGGKLGFTIMDALAAQPPAAVSPRAAKARSPRHRGR